MSKALVINGANFSANAFTTIIVSDPIPCTSIELSQSTGETVSIGATINLTAAVMPRDTTDMVGWVSSNTDVLTVNNSGVVTSVGVGVATITATCGEHSDSCTIVSKAFMDTENVLCRIGYYLDGADIESGQNGLVTWRDASDRCTGFASSTGIYPFYSPADPAAYPYVIPNGTERIKISIANTSAINSINAMLWFNHETPNSEYTTKITCIRRQTSGLNLVNGECIVNIPEISGYPTIDSFAIGLRAPGGTTVTTADVEGVTIEFLPADE